MVLGAERLQVGRVAHDELAFVVDVEHAVVNPRGEDRLLCFDENGDTCLILTSWTDYLPPDPFVSASDGRANFRFSDLADLNSFLKIIENDMST